MATAAAVGSPLSVLVYPEPSAPVVWSAPGFDGKPQNVIAVGLDMFGYKRGRGEVERGALVLEIVKQHSRVPITSA